MTQEVPQPVDLIEEARLLPLASSLIFRVESHLGIPTDYVDSFPEFDSEQLMEVAGKKINGKMDDTECFNLFHNFSTMISHLYKHKGEKPVEIQRIGFWAGLQVGTLAEIRIRNFSDRMFHDGRNNNY